MAPSQSKLSRNKHVHNDLRNDFRNVEDEMMADDDEEALGGSDEDDTMKYDALSDTTKVRIVIGIDFGTTFSCVAYVILPIGVAPGDIRLEDFECIGNYPGFEASRNQSNIRRDVPTELWYEYGFAKKRREPATKHNEVHLSENQGCESIREEDDHSGSDLEISEEDESPEASTGTSTLMMHRKCTRYFGYSVQQRLNTIHKHKDDARPLKRFKLNLNPKEQTEIHRKNIQKTLEKLMKMGIIEDKTDIYTHYLTDLLQHAKEQLKRSNELQDNMHVEYALGIPPTWPTLGVRILQNSLEKAVRKVGIDRQDENSMPDIFIVSEPEATAEWCLKHAGSDVFVSKLDRFC
jgi:hypothetical protein